MFKRLEQRRSSLANAPARAICLSFLGVIAVGTFLLALPISSRDGNFTNLLDALFTATSATCVTGLVVFDTATKFTLFGQLVILALIQVGGLGLVTITTFFNLIIGRRLAFHSMQRAQEAISLEGRLDINATIRLVVKATFCVEGIGALLLCLTFVPKYGLHGVFISFFLAISSFCNAGFDILGFENQFGSLCAYNASPLVLVPISLLIILGGLGFIVWYDLIEYHKTHKLMLHARVVLLMSALLIVVGTLLFLVMEWSNPLTMQGMPLGEKVLSSYFQSVSSRTAGFNSIDITAMRPLTKVMCMVLMFIGAAPGSTGGGIKVTTMAVLALTVVSVIKGRDETVILHRKVSKSTVYKSLAIIILSGLLVITAGCVMYFTLPHASIETGINALFEAVSAFATVGLSSGVTAVANLPSKLILILTMFTGRVGPISFLLFLAMRAGGPGGKSQVMPEGKIMVG